MALVCQGNEGCLCDACYAMMSDGEESVSSWVDLGPSLGDDCSDGSSDGGSSVDYDDLDDVEIVLECLYKCHRCIDDICLMLRQINEASLDESNGLSAIFFLTAASSQLKALEDVFMFYDESVFSRDLFSKRCGGELPGHCHSLAILELVLYLLRMVYDGKFRPERSFVVVIYYSFLEKRRVPANSSVCRVFCQATSELGVSESSRVCCGPHAQGFALGR